MTACWYIPLIQIVKKQYKVAILEKTYGFQQAFCSDGNLLKYFFPEFKQIIFKLEIPVLLLISSALISSLVLKVTSATKQ